MKDTELQNTEVKELIEESEEKKFLAALETVRKGYITAIAVATAIAIGAIICSVHYQVLFGLLLLVLSAVTYLAIVINLLYSKLGVAYRAFHGGMTVTALYGKDREVVYIPDKVIMLTVTEIGTRAFTHESSKKIREIHLPKTILRIGTSAFARLPELTDVYYEGTEEEWNKISRLAPLENVTMHFEAPIPKLEKPKKKKKSNAADAENAEK